MPGSRLQKDNTRFDLTGVKSIIFLVFPGEGSLFELMVGDGKISFSCQVHQTSFCTEEWTLQTSLPVLSRSLHACVLILR